MAKYSGPIWRIGTRKRSQIVRRVCEAMETTYGAPRHNNPSDPVDDLVFIVLSNRTSPTTARATFKRLRTSFSSWESMLETPIRQVRQILRPAGLSVIKSRQIRSALRRIRSDYGACDLTALRRPTVEEAEAYLVSLPGVSEKVAKCVLMYTLGAAVLPVDAHVHRIAGRLGWTKRKRADQCHEELEALVTPKRRFKFHVDCIAHGRVICRPANPLCRRCCVRRHCQFYRRRG